MALAPERQSARKREKSFFEGKGEWKLVDSSLFDLKKKKWRKGLSILQLSISSYQIERKLIEDSLVSLRETSSPSPRKFFNFQVYRSLVASN